MSARRNTVWLLVVGAIVVGAVSWVKADDAKPVQQPIAYNHQLHIEQDLTCTDCHVRVEKGKHATFPSIKVCLMCHSDAQGEHPDEPKIREYADRGEAIPWIQVNRLPGHVYFSHAAHTRYAGMDCAECHGDMTQRSQPVSVPQIGHLTMNRCIECHEQRSVSVDCLRCHK